MDDLQHFITYNNQSYDLYITYAIARTLPNCLLNQIRKFEGNKPKMCRKSLDYFTLRKT